MQVFAWSPTSRETLDEFNARLLSFCTSDDTGIVDADISVAGDMIFVSLTEFADTDVDPRAVVPCIAPHITRLAPEMLVANNAHVETVIDSDIAAIAKLDSDDNASVPFRARFFPMASGGAYGVIFINSGEVGGDTATASEER